MRLRENAQGRFYASAGHSHAVHGDGAAHRRPTLQLYLVPKLKLTTNLKKLTSLSARKKSKNIDKSETLDI